MSPWKASQYLKFGDERTRAAEDLAGRIRLESPARIVDLGCGPGNSTRILRKRWPGANILGVDNSPEMIQAALESYPDEEWLLADLVDWTPDTPVDLIYSNAALHWLPDHGQLIPRLFSLVADGGALAFQIPSSTFVAVRKLIHEISFDSAWSDRMESARQALTMESTAFYYDSLVEHATGLDIWETEYCHVLESQDAIIDWISSTGLRPFLESLSDEQERARFLAELRGRVADEYETRIDGRVLFPFRRTFVIAGR